MPLRSIVQNKKLKVSLNSLSMTETKVVGQLLEMPLLQKGMFYESINASRSFFRYPMVVLFGMNGFGIFLVQKNFTLQKGSNFQRFWQVFCQTDLHLLLRSLKVKGWDL